MHPNQMLQGGQAPHARHLEVEQDHVGLPAIANAAESLLAIPSRLDAEGGEFEDGLKVAQHQRGIVDDQNRALAPRRTSHVRGRERPGRGAAPELPKHLRDARLFAAPRLALGVRRALGDRQWNSDRNIHHWIKNFRSCTAYCIDVGAPGEWPNWSGKSWLEGRTGGHEP